MPVTLPKISVSLCLTASILLSACRFCGAQTTPPQPEPTTRANSTSASLPDAPQPHNTPTPPPATPSKPEPITLAGTPRRILLDQKAIWTSPLHLQPSDAIWLLPLAAVTGTMIGSDQHTMNDLIR